MNTVSFNSLGNQGRLGNQMFQFAALLAIAKENNYKFLLPNPKKVHYDNYALFDIFKLNSVSENNFGISSFNNIQTIDSDNFNYSDDYFELNDSVNLEGYFQSKIFVEKIKEDIKNNFQFKESILNKLRSILNSDSMDLKEYTFIHIRRGDYLEKKDYHFNLGMTYYKNAIKEYENNQKFLLFSDDIDWAKKEFLTFDNIYFFSDFYKKNDIKNSDLIEFAAMAFCNGGIISNSSFSWWAAYLQFETGNICHPNSDSWFGYKYNMDTKDLFFENWNEISPGKYKLLILKIKRYFYSNYISFVTNFKRKNV